MKSYILHTIVLLSSMTFTACTSNTEVIESNEEEMNSQPTVPKEKKTVIAQSNTYSGFITVPPAQKISIHTPVSGFIRGIRVIPGSVVKKGQLLAKIEHRDIVVLQENYLKKLAAFEFTSIEFERKKKLHDQQVISPKEFQEISAQYQSMKVSIQSYERQLQLIGISPKNLPSKGIVSSLEIRALSNGILTAIHANEGMFAQQEAPLFELLDTTSKYIEFEVYSADIDKISVGQSLKFTVVGNPTTFELKVASMTSALNQNKQNLIVVSESLKNKPELVVGSRVFVTPQ